jgi:hypothetical protein
VYTLFVVWASLLLCFPCPLPGRTCSALLFSNFVKEKT